jgi:hypothetical protein
MNISAQSPSEPRLSFGLRLRLYVALWVFIGIIFAVAVQFMPGNGYSPGMYHWLDNFKEGVRAFVGAPIGIVMGFALVAPRQILAGPALLYLGLHGILSLAFSRRWLFIVLCCIHIIVAIIAAVALVQYAKNGGSESAKVCCPNPAVEIV